MPSLRWCMVPDFLVSSSEFACEFVYLFYIKLFYKKVLHYISFALEWNNKNYKSYKTSIRIFSFIYYKIYFQTSLEDQLLSLPLERTYTRHALSKAQCFSWTNMSRKSKIKLIFITMYVFRITQSEKIKDKNASS